MPTKSVFLESQLYEHLICTLIYCTDIPLHKAFKRHCSTFSGGGLFALCKDGSFELSDFRGRWGVQLALLLLTPLLLLHQGYRLVHKAITEMGAGPGLLAGRGEMWACKSPRTIPSGSRGLEKSRTASNGKSLMPHSWEKLALTPSSFSSVGFATLSHQAKKGSLSSAPLHISLLLLPLPSLIRNCSNNAWDNLCACICQGILQYSWIWQHTKNMAWPYSKL